ncbi:hypothetical protein B0H16DRAFT_292527 [Mycena metata]|uniref:Uncharacterized protein n=1 Tax=Mycena metata TaxID=1033252 RepID=A0AAD7KF65_9AGAR|nr:hypothetical protein B0H16DRAFT_292527 [Mycena metata]
MYAVLVTLASLLALTVVRLHFLLAVSAHYSALVKAHQYAASGAEAKVDGGALGGRAGEARAIRLLPLPRGVRAEDMVYAPVHCPSAGESVLGTWAEVWVRESPMPTPYAPGCLEQAQTPTPGEVKWTGDLASYVRRDAAPHLDEYAPAYVAVAACIDVDLVQQQAEAEAREREAEVLGTLTGTGLVDLDADVERWGGEREWI